MPNFHIFIIGWIGFEFLFTEDVDKLLTENRYWGPLLDIQIWQSTFDPRREILFMWRPWVELPSLPIEIWNNEVLKVLGNGIGKIIA